MFIFYIHFRGVISSRVTKSKYTVVTGSTYLGHAASVGYFGTEDYWEIVLVAAIVFGVSSRVAIAGLLSGSVRSVILVMP